MKLWNVANQLEIKEQYQDFPLYLGNKKLLSQTNSPRPAIWRKRNDLLKMKSLYEWNIDELSQYNILNELPI